MPPPLAKALERAAKKNKMSAEQAEACFRECFTLKQIRPVSGTVNAKPIDD